MGDKLKKNPTKSVWASTENTTTWQIQTGLPLSVKIIYLISKKEHSRAINTETILYLFNLCMTVFTPSRGTNEYTDNSIWALNKL